VESQAGSVSGSNGDRIRLIESRTFTGIEIEKNQLGARGACDYRVADDLSRYDAEDVRGDIGGIRIHCSNARAWRMEWSRAWSVVSHL